MINALVPGIRLTNLLLAIGAAALICIGLFYFQEALGLAPCALCITQRIFIIAGGVLAAVAFVFGASGIWRRVLAFLAMLMAIIGGCFSARQLYLQSLPEDLVPACGPSLSYLLDAFPLREALMVLLQGDGNCAEVTWSLWGLSIPGWTLVAFAGIALINLWQLLRKEPAPW